MSLNNNWAVSQPKTKRARIMTKLMLTVKLVMVAVVFALGLVLPTTKACLT